MVYEIGTANFYEDITPNVLDKFDTSNYAGEHSSGITIGVNKKTKGKFKDEFGGKIMKEFLVHRAKMYAYKVDEEVTKKQRELTKCDQA